MQLFTTALLYERQETLEVQVNADFVSNSEIEIYLVLVDDVLDNNLLVADGGPNSGEGAYITFEVNEQVLNETSEAFPLTG